VDARLDFPHKNNSDEYDTMMKLLTTPFFKPIDILLKESGNEI